MTKSTIAEVRSTPRHWKLFERSKVLPPFQLTARDLEIVRLVYRHGYLRPQHIHARLGGSPHNLARRCKLLWEHRFLERPHNQLPVFYLTQQIIYALGQRGAEALQELDPNLRIADLDWMETPKKRRGEPHLSHTLGVAEFFVCLDLACRKRGLEVKWDGDFQRKGHKISSGRMVLDQKTGQRRFHPRNLQPDGYFRLYNPKTKQEAHHFLEFDRATKNLETMRERFDCYFHYRKHLKKRRPFEHFRVIVIAPDQNHTEALRRTASEVGKDDEYGRAWWGLWFSHVQAYSIEHPEKLLEPIFLQAFEGKPRSLLS